MFGDLKSQIKTLNKLRNNGDKFIQAQRKQFVNKKSPEKIDSIKILSTIYHSDHLNNFTQSFNIIMLQNK